MNNFFQKRIFNSEIVTIKKWSYFVEINQYRSKLLKNIRPLVSPIVLLFKKIPHKRVHTTRSLVGSLCFAE